MFGTRPRIPLSLRRTCRDALAISGWEGTGLVMGFTSALPREGVTTVVLCMAAVYAEADRVLVIDASSGGSSAASAVGCERKALTASDLMAVDPRSIDALVTTAGNAGFDLLTIESSLGLVTTIRTGWQLLRAAFMTKYRIILVDLGSLPTQFSPSWSAILDRTFLVVDPSRTKYYTLSRAKQEMEILKLPISGAILNKTTARSDLRGGA